MPRATERIPRSILVTVVALLAAAPLAEVRPESADGVPVAAAVAIPGSSSIVGLALAAMRFAQTSPSQDSDGDGVRDARDACPLSPPGSSVNELGCVEESRSGLVALLIGVGVFLLVAMGVARWWYGQPAEREPPPEKDWVVLPVSSAAKDAGIKPAPRAPAPPPGRGSYGPGRPAPSSYPDSQPGYPPQTPGYPPQPWPAQPGYYPPPNYPNPGYGAPPAYPPQGPPAYPPAPPPQPPTSQPGPPAGTRAPGGVPAEPPTGPPAQPAAQHRQPAPIGPEEIPDGQAVDEGQVRFHVPPEGTLQLLPGRLDVVGGDPGRGGIRFVKIPREDPELTFGRSAGPQYRHIQLKIPTVSRMHARMWFQDGVWSIENLSETNPVVVNDQPMGLGSAGSLALKDGDRIEMGEVVFRYWI